MITKIKLNRMSLSLTKLLPFYQYFMNNIFCTNNNIKILIRRLSQQKYNITRKIIGATLNQ